MTETEDSVEIEVVEMVGAEETNKGMEKDGAEEIGGTEEMKLKLG